VKALTISDHEEMILALPDEVRRSPEARYDHRLHGVLLVAQGLCCGKSRGDWETRPARSKTGSIGSINMALPGWPTANVRGGRRD
jgi:hypothetical protein